MVVEEVTGSLSSYFRKAGGSLVVVDFYAVWCGPCKMMHPVYEQLSNRYRDVMFLRCEGDKNKDISSSEGITGFPTFKFYLKGSCVDQLVGADAAGLEAKVKQWAAKAGPSTFGGKGMTLASGNTSQNLTPEEIRRRRLEKLAGSDSKTSDSAPKQQATSISTDAANPELLSELLAMGFDNEKAKEALIVTNNESLDVAVEYIVSNLSETKETYTQTKPKRQHVECDGNTCHLVDDDDVDDENDDTELIAQMMKKKKSTSTSTDESSSSSSTTAGAVGAPSEPPKQLTEEEKKKLIQQKIDERRRQKEAEEKKRQIELEKKRIEEGKKMIQTKEEIEAQQRKIEAEKKKREKLEEERQRLQLLEEWKLQHPNSQMSIPTEKAKELTPEENLDKYGKAISLNTYNNEGRTCLRTLRAYLNNLTKTEDPNYEKFLKIGTQNQAYVNRVKNVIGGVQFLHTVGYKDEGEFLVWENRDMELVKKGLEVIGKYYHDYS